MEFDFNLVTWQPFNITNNKSISYRLHDKIELATFLVKRYKYYEEIV